MTIILETPRLIARELTHDDLDFIAQMLSHPDVMSHWPHCFGRDESLEWIDRQLHRYRTNGFGYWLLLEKQSNQPVGQVGLLMSEYEGGSEPGLGYMIHHPFWRRGFATEASREILRFGFRIRTEDQIIALIRPENTRSVGVAVKLGMQPGRTVMHAGLPHVLYSIDRATFESQDHSQNDRSTAIP